MATREVLPVADLIPGDILISMGKEVVGYPYGKDLPGTVVPLDWGNDIVVSWYFNDSEQMVDVIRTGSYF